MAGELRLKSLSESISEFIRDCKDMQLLLKTFKRQIKVIVPIKY